VDLDDDGLDRFMLVCQRCGRTRSRDIRLELDGFHCRNCRQIVDIEDVERRDVGYGRSPSKS
jgi:late competence protein required for DNA uptake (superfamily II DNA/RNA helicase)